MQGTTTDRQQWLLRYLAGVDDTRGGWRGMVMAFVLVVTQCVHVREREMK